MPLFGRKTVSAQDTEIPIDVTTYEDSIYGRSDARMECLRQRFATSSDIGKPFGADTGLDVASQWTSAIVPEPLEYRPIGSRAADAMIGAIRSGDLHMDDILEVLGVSENALLRSGLRKSQRLDVGFTYDAFANLLLAMSKGDMNAMSKWFKDDWFAIRMTAYMLVAVLRLQASGTSVAY